MASFLPEKNTNMTSSDVHNYAMCSLGLAESRGPIDCNYNIAVRLAWLATLL